MKKILFLANHFMCLYSNRTELIDELLKQGFIVYLSLPKSDENSFYVEKGCIVIETCIDRRGVNPVKDLKLIREYKKMIKKINPDIVFSYTIKPNIYGAFACNKLKVKQVCNITGMGGTFLKKSFVSRICMFLYRHSVRKSYKVFFQNKGDLDFFKKNKMINDNYDLIPGSGCNLETHPFSEMPSDSVVRFIFIGRVMKLKGIDEYLECARFIKTKYLNTEFIIAGWNEEEKYKQIIGEYQKNGYINYIGFTKDIFDWISKCHCTILPSHGGEGVPNVLLETAAAGRVCIGSNINGTCDVIDDEKTGFLFNQGDAGDLIKKVEMFLKMSLEDKKNMGIKGRAKIENEFNRKIIINKYLEELYE